MLRLLYARRRRRHAARPRLSLAVVHHQCREEGRRASRTPTTSSVAVASGLRLLWFALLGLSFPGLKLRGARAPAGALLCDGRQRWPGRATPQSFGYGYQVWLPPGPRRTFRAHWHPRPIDHVDPKSKLVMVQTARCGRCRRTIRADGKARVVGCASREVGSEYGPITAATAKPLPSTPSHAAQAISSLPSGGRTGLTPL